MTPLIYDMDHFLGWNKSWQPLVRIVPAYVNTITSRTILISTEIQDDVLGDSH